MIRVDSFPSWFGLVGRQGPGRETVGPRTVSRFAKHDRIYLSLFLYIYI